MREEKNYTVRTRINKPVAEVFRAVVDSGTIINYFVNRTSSDLIQDARVTWEWDNYGANEVLVKRIVENQLIELILDSQNWDKTTDDAYEVTVSIEFESLDDQTTMVSISESGWKHDAEGYRGSHDNCGGWQDMLLCLKAYLEYKVDLRE